MRISDWSSDVCSSYLADPLYPHGAPGRVRRLLPRSLLGLSVLIIITPLILLQVISTWVFYDRHYDTITKRLAQGRAGDVAAVIALLEPEPQLQERREVFQMARSAMQLQLSLTPDAELPAVELPRVRTL